MTAAIGYLAAAQPSAVSGPGQPLATVLLAPIDPPPQNVMCVGKNYHAHAREFAGSGFDASAAGASDAIPQHPIIFTKPSSSISGPTDDIPLWPGLDEAVDYEVELAVIIGQSGRCISRDAAMRHVFGYTVLNHVTARDLQQRQRQWFLEGDRRLLPGAVDHHGRGGRSLAAMRVSCTVNGETRQDAAVADLIFDVPTLIEALSRSITLTPGDVIATGTPDGVGIDFKPPRFLREGDVVECAITGLGSIRNVVRRVTAS